MLFRKAAFVVTMVLVLGCVGGAVWFWKSHRGFYSSPTAVRTNENYLRAHAPGTNLPAVPTNLFSSIRVEQTTNQIEIWIPGPHRMSVELDYAPLQIHRAPASEPIRLESGSVRLAYLATGHAPPGTNTEWQVQLPGNFYTSDLKPVATEETSDFVPKYERKVSYEGDFPAANFYFASSNLGGFKTLGFEAFDARTHQSLTTGHGRSGSSNLFWFTSTIRLWHQTPIELITTVAAGPVQSYALEPKPGSELKYPGGVIRLVASSEVGLGGTSTRSDGRTNYITMRSAPRTLSPYDPRPRSSFIFCSWPNTRLRGELEFYGEDGEKIATESSTTSDLILHVRLVGRVEEVKEIRVKYYPNLHRLIYILPELPGLPEQNRHLENLFDTHIPYMLFQYEYAFQANIAQLLQMNSGSFALNYPNGFFPTLRTNTMARELFEEMDAMLANKKLEMVADPVENKIEARPPALEILIGKIKRAFGLKP